MFFASSNLVKESKPISPKKRGPAKLSTTIPGVVKFAQN
jgi:hypothetical protein